MLHSPYHANRPRLGAEASDRYGYLYPYSDPPLEVEPEKLHALAATMSESVQPSGDNERIPAAYTYLAQLVDHDLTFDPRPISEMKVKPEEVRNFRTPAFDLDCVYGAGPVVQPWLFDRDQPDLLQTGCTLFVHDGEYVEGHRADLPRSCSGFALIADPRNDENVIVAQLHVALLHFHNQVVHWLRQELNAGEPESLFEAARAVVVRHYQWVVVHDFLPRIAGKHAFERARRCSALADSGRAFLPVEFSGAAYRFGHSMIRSVYNLGRQNQRATLAKMFANTGSRRPAGHSKVGAPINVTWMAEWRGLLGERKDLPDSLSRLIDPYLADELHQLATSAGLRSLAEMNLLRGNMLHLPSGQTMARVLRVPALSCEQLTSGPDGDVIRKQDMCGGTPLWYYVLKEAQCMCCGLRLGPVGSQIVADVFYGLLALDPDSILNCKPDWRPFLPSRTPGTFTLYDLLDFAGVLTTGDDREPRNAPSLGMPSGRKIIPDALIASIRPD